MTTADLLVLLLPVTRATMVLKSGALMSDEVKELSRKGAAPQIALNQMVTGMTMTRQVKSRNDKSLPVISLYRLERIGISIVESMKSRTPVRASLITSTTLTRVF